MLLAASYASVGCFFDVRPRGEGKKGTRGREKKRRVDTRRAEDAGLRVLKKKRTRFRERERIPARIVKWLLMMLVATSFALYRHAVTVDLKLHLLLVNFLHSPLPPPILSPYRERVR